MEENTSSVKSMDEHVLKSKKSSKPILLRVIITFIFLASLSMCAKETNNLVLMYLTNPVNTHIIMNVNNVMKFPAITVCNLNPVRRFKWKERSVDISRNASRTLIRRRGIDFSVWMRNDMVKSVQYHVQYLRELDESFNRTRNKKLVYSKDWTEPANGNLKTINNILKGYEIVLNDVGTEIIDKDSNITSRITSYVEAMKEAREKARRYLYILASPKANFTIQSGTPTENVTTNKTAVIHKGKITKLPPSKDLQAFNNYLEKIGEMRRDDIADLGHQKEDFIALCSWQGVVCKPSHFHAFQDIIYGNCFTFNTSHVGDDVKKTGPRNGLALSLYVEQDEYIDRVAPAAGARVVIHEHDQKPFPEDEGFPVAAGHTTTVLINKFSTTTVQPMCDPNIEISHRNNNNDTSYKYSQKACVRQCLSKTIQQECNCSGVQFLLDRNDSCSIKNPEQESCVQRLEGLSRKNMLPNCSCPAPCRITRYEPIISSALWPAEKYVPLFTEELIRVGHKSIQFLNNRTANEITEFFGKNFLRVNIFFDKLVEQGMVNSYAYTLKNLLSDIGGQLGLWIGVSVATVHESMGNLFAFANFIYKYIRKKIRRRKICSFDKKAGQSVARRSYKMTSSNIAFDVERAGPSILQFSQKTLSTMSPYMDESLNSLAPWYWGLRETESESIHATSTHASKNSPFPRRQNMWSVDSHTSANLSSGTPTFGSNNRLRVDSFVDDTIVYDFPRVTPDVDTCGQDAVEAVTSTQQSPGQAVTRTSSKISDNSPEIEPRTTPKNKLKVKPKSNNSQQKRNNTPTKQKKKSNNTPTKKKKKSNNTPTKQKKKSNKQ